MKYDVLRRRDVEADILRRKPGVTRTAGAELGTQVVVFGMEERRVDRATAAATGIYTVQLRLNWCKWFNTRMLQWWYTTRRVAMSGAEFGEGQ